ncbi:MAG: hypothetical protein SFZ23_13310 [Planctomycetota bacterium]|nr:hypothetical protein [Planctomycetota bacterium]
MLALPLVQGSLGNARLSASSVKVGLDATVELRGVVISAPGVPGIAGRVAEADLVRVRLSLGGGKPRVRAVELIQPIVRVSQSTVDGSLNLAFLRPPEGGSDAPPELPIIDVRQGRLELGEHSPSYAVLKQIVIDGTVRPDTKRDGYVIAISEVVERGKERGQEGSGAGRPVSITGHMDRERLEMRLHGLSLEDWPPSVAPSPIRPAVERLALVGEVQSATFKYEFGAEPRARAQAELQVQDVALNLPVEADVEVGSAEVGSAERKNAGGAPELLRMTRTSGVIRFTGAGIEADLRGFLEELPYTVELRTRGLDVDRSGFVCTFTSEEFKLEKDLRVLRFVGPIARYRLEQFGPPTGIVSTRVEISRGDPVGSEAAQVRLNGRLQFRDTTAAFWRFPYEFEKMHGKVRFSDDEIVIEEIHGRSRSGAVLLATGHVRPPTQDADIEIKVKVTQAPIDLAMEEAMGSARRRALLEVFSRDRYEEILASGVVLTPERAAELRREREAAVSRGEAARVAELDRALRAPEFEFRGLVDVDVFVKRHPGTESRWDDITDVRMARVGALPQKFPMPLIATDVRMRVENGVVRVQGGRYEGLHGGEATISALADLSAIDDPTKIFAPEIDIGVQDVPIDDLSRFAIGAASDRGGAEVRARVEQILNDLGLSGRISATARVAANDLGEVGFDVKATLLDAMASPASVERPVLAVRPADVPVQGAAFHVGQGDVHVTQQGLEIRLDGVARQDGLDDAPARLDSRVTFRPARGEGEAQLVAGGQDGAGAPDGGNREGEPAAQRSDVADGRQAEVPAFERSRSLIQLQGMRAGFAAEEFVRVFSPDAATTLWNLRSTTRPEGEGEVDVRVVTRDRQTPEVVVGVDGLRGFQGTYEGRVIEIAQAQGRLVVTPGQAMPPAVMEGAGAGLLDAGAGAARATHIAFHSWSAPDVLVDGQASGSIWLDGSLLLGKSIAAGGPLTLRLTRTPVESALTKFSLERVFGASATRFYEMYGPSGTFDLGLTIERQSREWSLSGVTEPSTLRLVVGGVPVEFDQIRGQVGFERDRGEFQGVVAATKDWSLSLDGSWFPAKPGVLGVNALFSLDSQRGMTPDLRAVLPADLVGVLDQLAFGVDGPLLVRDGKVSLHRSAAPEERSFRTSGVVSLSGGKLLVGLPIESCMGEVAYDVKREAEGQPVEINLRSKLSTLKAGGVRMTNARVEVRSDPSNPGAIAVPVIEADCHGGRFAGSARLWPEGVLDAAGGVAGGADVAGGVAGEAGASPKPAKRYAYQSDLRFSGVRLAPLLADLDAARGKAPKPDASSDPESRGSLDATLTLEGIAGDSMSRTGRLLASIGGGRVVDFPLMLSLVRASNLQLPTNDKLDLARASAYINGTVLTFEELSVLSQSVSLVGFGTMTWPGMALDMRFNSRSEDRLPLVSWALEGVRNELISTNVRGTVESPKIEVVQFPKTGRLLNKILGRTSDQDHAMEQIERAGEDRRNRARILAKPGVDVTREEE